MSTYACEVRQRDQLAAMNAWRANKGLPPHSAHSRGAAVAESASYSLESRTLFQHQGPWKVTCLDFGDGLIEARCVYIDQPVKGRKGGKREGERKEDTVRRSVERACMQMRRRMWALRPNNLLTLTKRGKFPTVDDAWQAWEKFSAMCSREFGPRWKFVVVPEMHAVFGWHLHVALNGFFDVKKIRVFWHRALGASRIKEALTGEASPGNVDFSQSDVKNDVQRLASYLGKYLGKSFAARGINRRAFAASKGLVPQRVIKVSMPVCVGNTTPSFLLRRELEDFFGVELELYEWRESWIPGFTLKTKRKER